MPRTPDDRQLTAHFWLSEFTVSQATMRAGLANVPLAVHENNLQRLALVLEGVRALLRDAPLSISSGYRSPAVNKLVGGSKTSAHMDGRAADFVAPGFGPPRLICQAIAESQVPFDQLIFEGGWVHLGIAAQGEKPRREVLTAIFVRGERTRYVQGVL